MLAGPPAAADTPAAQARVIVKLEPAPSERLAERPADRLGRMAQRHGAEPKGQRPLGGAVRLLTATGIDSATLAKRLAADPEVAYAVPDRRMRRNAVPNDPLYGSGGAAGPVVGQWYLRTPNATFVSAIDAQGAWDTAKGDGVVVAVLDTGVRFDHPDLAGKLRPGYDFVRDDLLSGDGSPGRDADASDPGDFVTEEQAAAIRRAHRGFRECEAQPSSWHGTNVAGILAAATGNGTGVAGVGWNAQLLPVRVLGKCGGFESDIVEAMRWAAGIHIDGVPDNPAANRAEVINLSLGGPGACGAAYEDAIADVTAVGTVVVASVGNEAGHRVAAPANCDGVISVGGLRHAGTKVGFSDLGPEVSLSAPAGNCVNVKPDQPCLFPLTATSNAGTNTPGTASYTNGSDDIAVGTSFSAPLVAGAAALLLQARPGLTPLQVKLLLQSSARPFPSSGADTGEADDGATVSMCTAPQYDESGSPVDQLQCYCSTGTCGAGMLDARAAVLAAVMGPPSGVRARIDIDPVDPRAKEALQLSAEKSLAAAGNEVTGYQWTLLDGGGIADAIGDADAARASVTPSGPGRIVLRLTVSGAMGTTSSTDLAVEIRAAPPQDDGGGGGALGAGWLLALLAALAATRLAVQRRDGPAR